MTQIETVPACVQHNDEFPDDLLFDTTYPVHEEGFVVDTLEKATWATRRYLSAAKRSRERQNLADSYKQKIDEWLEYANKADKDTQSFMQYLLAPYVRDYIEQQKRGKSFMVFGARLGFRKGGTRLEIQDLNAAIDYCRQHLPDCLVTKTDIAKPLAKSYIADGFAIPGVSILEGQDELVIKEFDDASA